MAVFARAPVAGHVKTRLIPLLGAQGAARFQAALISDTLRKVAGLRRWVQPYLFWAASPIPFRRSHAEAIFYEQPLAAAVISEFSVIRQQGRDLGERLENAFRRLLRFHPSCVVIGTDSPLFPARILRQTLAGVACMRVGAGPVPRWRVLSDCPSTACRSPEITEHLPQGSLEHRLCIQRYASEPVTTGPLMFSSGGLC